MLSKLAILVAAFLLALSGAAFASPADAVDFAGVTAASEGAFDRADLVGAHDQDEIEEVQLYLGPVDSQEEIITDLDDPGVN